MSRISLTKLRQMKAEQTKIAVLTAYDASFSHVLEQAGVDVILVGDSLGMVIQGQESTLPVTVDDMVYHTSHVVRGSESVFVIADMPFMSYANPEQAIQNAARLMAEGGAQMVKLEGGAVVADTVRQLAERGIPVCAHLGLLPQSVHRLGGYRVQGRSEQDAEQLISDAQLLQQAGADMLVLECVPAELAKQVTAAVTIPVIGIGAGADCDGQVLVLYDMLGLTPGKRPRFSHDFLADTGAIPAAIAKYVADVKSGEFPPTSTAVLMQLIEGQTQLRQQVLHWRQQGQTIAFVPTMGNLHLGHLSLVNQAQQLADRVVVSIFVNPLQFNDPSDLSAYPRTLEADSDKLKNTGCDVLFTPTIDEMYPSGMASQTKVSVPEMDDKLCGLHRPGHFDGVATVVLKLFNMVQPDTAVFGEKDFQQLLLIKKMVTDLNLPIDIIAGPTYREHDGLAMSSRNQYLTPQQRELAAELHKTMQSIKQQLSAGEHDFAKLSQAAIQNLQQLGFEPEYLELRRDADLASAAPSDKAVRIFIAAQLGQARLIDNLACHLA